ncbi:MAG TPA: ornithine cyclodeaminase family protein [Gaiellaceae bacterium]|nr:ornithine cyclodeaminase family protein [Gaiellaceae bacterium]
MVPLFTARHVSEAVSPAQAVEAVRAAFVSHARGEWTMPPKVYLPAYPAGDFRAMPARGGGYALLKWISSFPGNPARGLPTVLGVALLSDASTGELLALLDAASLTALRTGAAAVLAADTLARPDAASVSVVGAGVNGRAVARTFLARGRRPSLYDLDRGRAEAAAQELGVDVCASLEEALAADVVATVTPGRQVLYAEGSLRAGQHVSLMGADGPDKQEIAPEELARVRVFCDDFEQAGHAGDLAHALRAGLLRRELVTELGAVLAGTAPGREGADEITAFDSTGLAVQDLAVALAAYERAPELDLPQIDV